MLLFEDKSQEWKKSWDSETKRLYNSLRIKDSFYDETDRSLETLELDINSNLHDSYDTRIRNLQGTAFALARVLITHNIMLYILNNCPPI